MVYKTIMIGYYPTATPASFEKLFKNIQDYLVKYSGFVDTVFTLVPGMSVKVPEQFAAEFIEIMKRLPDVESAYEEVEYFLNSYGSYQSYVMAPAPELIPWGIEYVNAPAVHAAGNRGAGVKVCIIDTGIDYTHPDLKANFKGGYNAIDDTNDPVDEHGHGTHVAGTVGANGRIIGVAPAVSIYSAKVFGKGNSTSTTIIIKGVQWAVDNGMNIISMSLGGPSSDPLLKTACDNAYAVGVLIIASAGNSGSEGAACGTNTIGYPALYDSVIAVTAVQCDGNLAYFSSRGSKAEITAPGVYVYSTFFIPWGPSKLKYRTWSGTSMSCPHISGCAALVWAANPSFTNVQVRQAIDRGATDLGGAGRDGCFGFGLIDAYAASYNTIPRGLPPTPTQTHSVCGKDGCISGICGATLADECNPDTLCWYCNDLGMLKICDLNPNIGTYKSADECVKTCKGYAWGECRETAGHLHCWPVSRDDPGAIPYDKCKLECEGVTKKYSCTGAPDYFCEEDKYGDYASLEECRAVCKEAECTPLGCGLSLT